MRLFIAAPDGQAGGGMGRVKDYILQSPADAGGAYVLCPMIVRDTRGVVASVGLLMSAVATLLVGSVRGTVGLLHVNMGDRGSVARKGLLVVCARLLGIPTLLHLHAVELKQHYAAAGPLLRWCIRRPFMAATSVIVLGTGYRDWLIHDLTIPADKIDVLYNGVDAAPQPPARDFTAGRTAAILFLGNMIERKGLSDFIAALGALPADTPPWRAIIAGGGTSEPYEAQARQLNIIDAIRFTGWVNQPQVRDLLEEADMLVLPSYDEGLPLVILEALGAGLPVICTPVGAIPETLTDGETVLFCAPGDRPGLSACIERLIRDPKLQAGLSARGRLLFDRLFSLSAFQRTLFAIYKRRAGVDYQMASDPLPPLPKV